MASKTPKKESLSRYFKDLEEFECDSDGSDDEINNDDKLFTGKTNNLISQNSKSPVGSKVVSKLNDSTENGQSVSSTSCTNSEKCADIVKCDAGSAIKQNKLPSASECLNTKSNPSFLKLSDKKEVNWDSCQKRLEGDGDGDDEEALNFKSNAVPPPPSYEPITDPGIKVVDSEGRKRKVIGDDLEDQMTSSKAYKVHKEKDDTDAVDDQS